MGNLSRGSGPDFWVAGRGFYSKKVMILSGYSGGAAYGTFKKIGDTTSYQVPTGKKLVVKALQGWFSGSSGGVRLAFGYGDTNVGNASGSAPTNPVYESGNTADDQIQLVMGVSSSSSDTFGPKECVTEFSVPAEKYLFVRTISNTQGVLRLFAELQDA